jgi:Peptidase A4 family
MRSLRYLFTASLMLSLLGIQATASAAPLVSPKEISQPNYAGYSWHPKKGFVTYSGSLWKIPKVDCSKAPTGSDGRHARAAVWVGLWGGPSTANAWLPQVGTVSRCQIDKSFPPAYVAFAQMYHNGGCKVAGDNGCKPQNLSMSVSPGDKMDGEVEYSGVGSGNHRGEYKFTYFLYDITTGMQDTGTLYTASSVLRSDVAYQGGAIVEDENGNGNPLAEFTSPITFTKVAVGNSSGALKSADTYLWKMTVGGKQLAKTGSFAHDQFQVTWQRWG